MGAELIRRLYLFSLALLLIGMFEMYVLGNWFGLAFAALSVGWWRVARVNDIKIRRAEVELADTRQVLHAALRHDPPSEEAGAQR